jgi:hypothetical protein
MSEKPILFCTEMVKAILEDRKTMTRRIFKNPMKKYVGYRNRCAELLDDSCEPLSEKEFYEVYSPYFKGDVLWVREAWSVIDWPDGTTARKYETVYRATPPKNYPYIIKWHPSIHLWKNKARLFLEVTGVRVERLQNITEKDAVREGMPESMTGASDYSRRCFHSLWDTLDAKRGYGWDKNPWVWVIEFGKVK